MVTLKGSSNSKSLNPQVYLLKHNKQAHFQVPASCFNGSIANGDGGARTNRILGTSDITLLQNDS